MYNTANPGERGRFSAPRKAATALRLLRSESLELLSRELGVTAATSPAGATTSWPAGRPPSRAGRSTIATSRLGSQPSPDHPDRGHLTVETEQCASLDLKKNNDRNES